MSKMRDFYKTNGLERVETQTHNAEASMTRQEFAEECDINTLMSKYEMHAIGGPGGLSPQQMFYADFTTLPNTLMEYHAFMDEAQRSFMMLPAVVRKEFENDATQFVEFASDPENLPQLRTWGLAPAEAVPEPPMKVEVVNPASTASDAPKAS